MSLFLFNILVIIGSFQGILTSVLLWLSSQSNLSRLILSYLLFVFVLLSSKILLHTLNLWQIPYLRYFPLAFELAIQPLFYLYLLSLIVPAFRLSRKDLYHFMPATLFMLHAMLVYIMVVGVSVLSQKDIIAETLHFNRVKTLEDLLVILSSVIYWYLGFQKVNQYRQWLYTNVSATNYPEYTWLRNLLLLTLILFFILGINILLDLGFEFGKRYFLHWQFFFLYMSGIIYYLGFKGYHQPSFLPLPVVNAAQELQLTPDEDLSAAVNDLKESIEKALTKEKIYLDPELSLGTFAKYIGTSTAVLSATINTVYQKNFRSLINEYRVEEVKKKLQDPACSHLSILGIALESGFNSEASFYRIFKNYTTFSPKEYLEMQHKTS